MISLAVTGVLALLSTATAWPFDNVQTVFQFPNNSFIENLAVRSSGQILVTSLTSPGLTLIDPQQPGLSAVVHNFTGFSALTGIVEYEPDVFAIASGGYEFETADFGHGTWTLWTVDLRGVEIRCGTLHGRPQVSKIQLLPEATLINGMTLLSNEDKTLLVAESIGGSVYRVNYETGDYKVVINNTYTHPKPTPAGVNGLHLVGSTLYFVNSAQGKIYKVAINNDGTPAGNFTAVAQVQGSLEEYDDFAIDCQGSFYAVTGSGNTIKKILPDGSQQLVAGNLNSTAVAEPSSAAFGRGMWDKNVLYVTTAGGSAVPVDGSITIPGKLLAINTNSQSC